MDEREKRSSKEEKFPEHGDLTKGCMGDVGKSVIVIENADEIHDGSTFSEKTVNDIHRMSEETARRRPFGFYLTNDWSTILGFPHSKSIDTVKNRARRQQPITASFIFCLSFVMADLLPVKAGLAVGKKS